MHPLAHFYVALFPFVPLAPLVIVIAAILITLGMSNYRWVAHSLTFVALFSAFPAYVWIEGILDPTTIEYPGPGDGFVLLLYLFLLIPAVVLYSTYAWFTRRRNACAVGSAP